MNKFVFKSILIILLSCLTMTGFAQQKKVAVYVTGVETINFQSGGKIEPRKIVSDKLMEAFVNSDKYIVIERSSSFIEEFLKNRAIRVAVLLAIAK